MAFKDDAYKTGCGRYIQCAGALDRAGEEAVRLGAGKAYILGGKTALSLAESRLIFSLAKAGVGNLVRTHTGLCCRDYCPDYRAEMERTGCNLVIGVGGGTVLDLAKLLAAEAGVPVMAVPTSAATCAACTPLSVMYTMEGRTEAHSTKHMREVDAVLADLDVLVTQPPRLLMAGAYDAMAKNIELRHRTRGKTWDKMALGLDYAVVMAEKTDADLRRLLPVALQDLQAGRMTPALERVIFINLLVTGVISGISRGSGQTAIAHEFYEGVRSLFPREAAGCIHGEIVAVGLAAQLQYNGQPEQIPSLRAMLADYGLPVTLADLGVPATEENLLALWEDIKPSGSMEDEGPGSQERLLEALRALM